MDFFNSKQFIVILVIVLIGAGLSGCAKPKINTDVNKNRQPTELETIGKLEAIGTVLGCMFDPAPCEEKRKELEQKEEMN